MPHNGLNAMSGRTRRAICRSCLLGLIISTCAGGVPAAAQTVETVGVRALGMGGAFVAVADDNSATWWNPAGLAAGPFLDVGLARTAIDVDGTLPAARSRTWSFALTTPPFGVSYYGFRVTDVRASPTGDSPPDRQDRQEGVGVRSLSVSQFGVTVLHTLLTGVHVGSTVKYVRGTARTAAIADTDVSLLSISDLLDAGAELSGGDSEGTADLDVGVLAVAGAVRVGAAVRNLTEPDFAGMGLPRQVRVGAAFDLDVARGIPATVALDADLRRYDAGSGERRVIAVGAEHWIVRRRFAVRGGGRFNTVGASDRVVTAGASVAVRAGVFADGYVAYGGDTGGSGWGVSARVSF
jgi:hypothetical protein